jgi:hypothetical protein
MSSRNGGGSLLPQPVIVAATQAIAANETIRWLLARERDGETGRRGVLKIRVARTPPLPLSSSPRLLIINVSILE